MKSEESNINYAIENTGSGTPVSYDAAGESTGGPNSKTEQHAEFLSRELSALSPYIDSKLPACTNKGRNGACTREIIDNLKADLIDKADHSAFQEGRDRSIPYLKKCASNQASKLYKSCESCLMDCSIDDGERAFTLIIAAPDDVEKEYEQNDHTCRFWRTLNASEQNILIMRNNNKSDDEIAFTLGCSVKTVQNKRSEILRKYEVFQ